MQAQATTKVKTFTVAFDDQTYNEAATPSGWRPTWAPSTPSCWSPTMTPWRVVPTLGHLYDEPFSDSSQLPPICSAG